MNLPNRKHRVTSFSRFSPVEWIVVTVISIIVVILIFCFYVEIRSWRLKEGFVTDRTYKSDWTEMQYNYDGEGRLSSVIPIHHPEEWSIEIQGEVDGEHVVRHISVSRDVYESVEPGQLFRVQ